MLLISCILLMDNPEDQIREENGNLHARLVQLITSRNLNSQLSGNDNNNSSSKIDGSSIIEMTDSLIRNGVLPSADGKIRRFLEEVRRLGDKVARGEKITREEGGNSNYSLGVGWLHSMLDLIEARERHRQQ
jgi:hypothetical protein